MKRFITQFIGNLRGTAALEYAIIAAGLSVAIILAVSSLGTNVETKFTDASSALSKSGSDSGGSGGSSSGRGKQSGGAGGQGPDKDEDDKDR